MNIIKKVDNLQGRADPEISEHLPVFANLTFSNFHKYLYLLVHISSIPFSSFYWNFHTFKEEEQILLIHLSLCEIRI